MNKTYIQKNYFCFISLLDALTTKQENVVQCLLTDSVSTIKKLRQVNKIQRTKILMELVLNL